MRNNATPQPGSDLRLSRSIPSPFAVPTKRTKATFALLLCILAFLFHPGCSCAPESPCLRVVCDAGQRCEEGKCVSVCEAPQSFCDGACVNTQTDNKHCGKCGLSCPSTQLCQQGSCQTRCDAPRQLCDGACIAPQANPNHCGTCGNQCPNNQPCQQGVCIVTCDKEQTNCNNTCADLQIDDNHCGVCGNKCSNGLRCKDGTCQDFWAVQGETTNWLYDPKIALDKKGDVYLCALSKGAISLGTMTDTPKGPQSLLLTKLNSKGQAQWMTHINGTGLHFCRGFGVSPAGDVFVTSEFEKTLTTGNTTLTAIGQADAFIAKWDTDGKFQWAKQMGGAAKETAFGLGVDANGNVYVYGRTGGKATFGSITLNLNPKGALYFAKLDSTGKFLFAKDHSSKSPNCGISLEAMTTDPKGNSYFVGRANQGPCAYGPLTTTINDTHMFVLKVNDKGEYTDIFAFKSNPLGLEIKVDTNENMYITGSFRGDLTCGTTTLTSLDSDRGTLFFAKFDSKGQCQWAHSVGSPQSDYIGREPIATNGQETYFATTQAPTFAIDGKLNTYSNTYTQFVLLKVNSQGKIAEVRTSDIIEKQQVPEAPPLTPSKMAVDLSGNAFLAGYFLGTLKLPRYTLISKSKPMIGRWNLFIAKNLP